MEFSVGHYLGATTEENLEKTYHVLSQFKILSEIHAMFDGVVPVTLHHHICDGLARPRIACDKFGNDV